jgi:hypothetical protein
MLDVAAELEVAKRAGARCAATFLTLFTPPH